MLQVIETTLHVLFGGLNSLFKKKATNATWVCHCFSEQSEEE